MGYFFRTHTLIDRMDLYKKYIIVIIDDTYYLRIFCHCCFPCSFIDNNNNTCRLTDRLLEIFERFIQSSCNCSPYQCCSKWGYCDLTNAYCEEGYQSDLF